MKNYTMNGKTHQNQWQIRIILPKNLRRIFPTEEFLETILKK